MGGQAETNKLLRKLQKQGFVVTKTRNGHWEIRHPDSPDMVRMSGSPKASGFYRSEKRLRAMGAKL